MRLTVVEGEKATDFVAEWSKQSRKLVAEIQAHKETKLTLEQAAFYIRELETALAGERADGWAIVALATDLADVAQETLALAPVPLTGP